MHNLSKRLNEISDQQPFVTNWYMKDLISGGSAERGGRMPLPTGSTRKTSIMMAVLRAVHRGRLSLDEPITYESRHREGVMSGTFKYLTPGMVVTLRDALVQMIIVSDNVCTLMILERITLAEINEFCRSIGMIDTLHRILIPHPEMKPTHSIDEVTTSSPIDQGLLYELILQGGNDASAAAKLGCSQALCAFALDVLTWQKFRNCIPCLLPWDAKVASKGGTGKRGRMDGAIVFRNDAPLFILTVYTDQVPLEMPDGLPGYAAAFLTMGQLARACWDTIGAA